MKVQRNKNVYQYAETTIAIFTNVCRSDFSPSDFCDVRDAILSVAPLDISIVLSQFVLSRSSDGEGIETEARLLGIGSTGQCGD